jgi:hypothetical protein
MASTVQIFDLLPFTIREGDGDGALRTLFEAVQQEYERHREEIRGLAVLIDAEGLNTTYQFQAQPTFDYQLMPEKLLLGEVVDSETIELVTNIAPTNDFYTGYALRVLRVQYDRNGDGIYEEDQDPAFPVEAANAYTKIVDYSYDSGTGVGTAKVYPPLPDALVGLSINVAFELSMPRFLYVPAEDNLGRQLVTTTDYYRDWFVRIYGNGPGGTPVQTRRITSFGANTDVNGNALSYIIGVETPFDMPPVATSYFGITNSYTNLSYLAQQVGYQVEATDPEALQKQQIMSAVQAYKLKGTLAAFKLLFKAFGFQSRISERASNYASASSELPGVPDFTQHDDSGTEISIGNPRLVDDAILRPLFSDGFDTGDLSKWDSAVTTGSATIAVTAGVLKMTYTNTFGAYLGKRVGYPINGSQTLGLVIEFDITPTISSPASGQTRILELGDSTHSTISFTLELYDTTRTLRYNTGFGYVDTGVTLAHNTKARLKIRLAGQFLQIYVNGALKYDSATIGYTNAPGTDAAIFPAAYPTSGLVSGTILYDNFSVSYPDNVLISSGKGEDSVTGMAWKKPTGVASDLNTSLRIPDSDLTVVLRKVHPGVTLNPDIFQRIVKRIEDIRPVHVEVALIGSAFDEDEPVELKDSFSPTFNFYETVSVGEDFALLPDSVAVSEGVGVNDLFLIILSDVRWDVSDNRFDGEDEARWDTD